MRVDHAAEGERRVVDEVVLERPADRERTFDQCEVGLANRLRGELRTQVVEGLRRPRHQNESGRIRVNPVDGAGQQGLVPQRRAFGVAGDHAVHQRRRFAARERLDGHPRRLVEREQGFVLEYARRTNRRIGGDDIVARLGERLDENRLATPKFNSLGRDATVEKHVTLEDGLFHKCPRGRGKRGKQSGVQTDAALFRNDCLCLNHTGS